MAALAVRADRLKLITPYQSKMFWIEMGKLGYRKREPNEPPKEAPKLLRQMIAFHMNKLGYSVMIWPNCSISGSMNFGKCIAPKSSESPSGHRALGHNYAW